jgi:hypothetical protein
MGKATAQDAELILKIYDLRREEVLRAARAWFSSKFEAETVAELRKKHPPGSKEDAYFRMVLSYWDMIGALVRHKTINEDLFFETNREYLGVWRRAQPIVAELRQSRNNPGLYSNLEHICQAYQQWSGESQQQGQQGQQQQQQQKQQQQGQQQQQQKPEW